MAKLLMDKGTEEMVQGPLYGEAANIKVPTIKVFHQELINNSPLNMKNS
jgi:hypothetical protein